MLVNQNAEKSTDSMATIRINFGLVVDKLWPLPFQWLLRRCQQLSTMFHYCCWSCCCCCYCCDCAQLFRLQVEYSWKSKSVTFFFLRVLIRDSYFQSESFWYAIFVSLFIAFIHFAFIFLSFYFYIVIYIYKYYCFTFFSINFHSNRQHRVEVCARVNL